MELSDRGKRGERLYPPILRFSLPINSVRAQYVGALLLVYATTLAFWPMIVTAELVHPVIGLIIGGVLLYAPIRLLIWADVLPGRDLSYWQELLMLFGIIGVTALFNLVVLLFLALLS